MNTNKNLHLKLSLVAGVAAIAEFTLAYFLYQRQALLLGGILSCSGAFTVLGSLFYLFYLLPHHRERLAKGLEVKKGSLSDILEWQTSTGDFAKPTKSLSVVRDWRGYLAASPLAIRCESASLLAQQDVALGERSIHLAYLRCEEQSLDKRVRLFDGWIAEIPTATADQNYVAEFARKTHIGVIALATFVTFALAGYMLHRHSQNLSVGEAARWMLGLGAFLVVALGAYARGFGHLAFLSSEESLPEAYRPIFRALASARDIGSFRMSVGPQGLLIAIAPMSESLIEEEDGVVPVEGAQSCALEAALSALATLGVKSAAA